VTFRFAFLHPYTIRYLVVKKDYRFFLPRQTYILLVGNLILINTERLNQNITIYGSLDIVKHDRGIDVCKLVDRLLFLT